MTASELVGFDEFLEESFREKAARELRLSNEEVAYLLSKYPTAAVTALSAEKAADGKGWYLVQF